jgi:3-methyladenine DNA glycosylase AlkD
VRSLAKKHQHLPVADILKLLHSKIHEERFLSLTILTHQFEKGDNKAQDKIYKVYLKNTKYINNWDLVDTSAPYIVGPYLLNRSKSILYKLVKSKNLWERRIAIITTLYFIKCNQFNDTLKLAELLLSDKHDLIHKATGWALRELGKKSLNEELAFLDKHFAYMPRTMLRYAIERLPEKQRLHYLKKQ